MASHDNRWDAFVSLRPPGTSKGAIGLRSTPVDAYNTIPDTLIKEKERAAENSGPYNA